MNSTNWREEKPKNSEELRKQIKNALLALQQWKDAAEIPNVEDGAMIEAQIFWLKELLELAHIELGPKIKK